MLNKKLRIFWGLSIIMSLILAVFAGGAAASDAPVVRIGILLPLTGADALDGQNQRNAHEFAAQEINALGGIAALGGAKIELVWGDTQGRVELGNAETERLIVNENVIAVMGAFHSGVTLSAVRIAEQYQVPFINPAALSVEITRQGMQYTFQTMLTTFGLCRIQGEVILYLNEKFGTEIRTVGIIRNDGFIGNQMILGWQEYLPKQGFDIVVDAVFPPAATNVQSAVLSLMAANPDVVVSQANAQEALLVIRTLKEMDWWPKYGVVTAGAGYSNPDVLNSLGELAEGLVLVSDWFPEINRPGSQEVNSRFREQFGTDMLGAANTAYASTWVVKEALEIAGAADRQKLFEVLRNLRLTGGRIGFMYDFVSFCDIGLNEGAQGVAAQVIDGRVLTVWPEEVRVAEPVWPVPHWNNR